jgi:hypothetical protein
MPKRKTYRKKRSYKKRSYKKRSYKKRSYKKRSYLRGGADEHLLTQPAGAWKGDEEQLSEALDTLEDFPAAAMDSPLPTDGGDGGEMEFGDLGFGGYGDFGDFGDESGGGEELDLGQSEFDFLGDEDLGDEDLGDEDLGSEDLGMLPAPDEPAGNVPGATLNAVANFGQLGSQPMAGAVSMSLGDEGGARAAADLGEQWDYTDSSTRQKPECMLVGIGNSAHRGAVQTQPFMRHQENKWVEMKDNPRKPMCTGCTATMRKHYTGMTNSPELAAAFVEEVERYKCPVCEEWKDGDIARAAEPPNLICTDCDWRWGKDAPNKPRGRSFARREAAEAAEPEHVPAAALDLEESRDELGAGRLDIEEFDPAGGTFVQHGVTAFMGNPMDLSLDDQTLQPLPAQAMQPPEPAAKARSRARSKKQKVNLPTRWRCRTDPGYTRTVKEEVDCYILKDESSKSKEINVRWSSLINIFNLLREEPCCTAVGTLSRGLMMASKLQCNARVVRLNSIFETMTDDQMDKFNEILMENAHLGDGAVCRGRSRVDPSQILCAHGTVGCHGDRVATRSDGSGGVRSRVSVHNKGCEGYVAWPREKQCSNHKTAGCQYNPDHGQTRHTEINCPGYVKRKPAAKRKKRKKQDAAPPVQAFAATPSPPGIQLAAMDPMAGGPPPPAYQVQPQPPPAQPRPPPPAQPPAQPRPPGSQPPPQPQSPQQQQQPMGAYGAPPPPPMHL